MSKKLVNSPEDAVDEALAGMVAVHPGLRLLEGHRVVVRADIASVVKEGKASSMKLCMRKKMYCLCDNHLFSNSVCR